MPRPRRESAEYWRPRGRLRSRPRWAASVSNSSPRARCTGRASARCSSPTSTWARPRRFVPAASRCRAAAPQQTLRASRPPAKHRGAAPGRPRRFPPRGGRPRAARSTPRLKVARPARGIDGSCARQPRRPRRRSAACVGRDDRRRASSARALSRLPPPGRTAAPATRCAATCIRASRCTERPNSRSACPAS